MCSLSESTYRDDNRELMIKSRTASLCTNVRFAIESILFDSNSDLSRLCLHDYARMPE